MIDLKGSVSTYTGQMRINCPFCEGKGKSTDDGHHLYISKSNYKYICFRCNSKGNFMEVYPNLQYYIDSDIDLDFGLLEINNGKITFDLSKISKELNIWDPECLYLESRNLSFEDIKFYQFRIGTGKYQGYIVIPVFDEVGDCIYFISRAVQKDNSVRYKNPPTVGRLGILANYNNAKFHYSVYLTEGFFTGKALGHNFIGQLGTMISNNQAQKIANLNKVIYCADSEVKVDIIVKNCNTILRYREEVYFIPVPRDRRCDAADLTPYELQKSKTSEFLVDSMTINDLPDFINNFTF